MKNFAFRTLPWLFSIFILSGCSKNETEIEPDYYNPVIASEVAKIYSITVYLPWDNPVASIPIESPTHWAISRHYYAGMTILTDWTKVCDDYRIDEMGLGLEYINAQKMIFEKRDNNFCISIQHQENYYYSLIYAEDLTGNIYSFGILRAEDYKSVSWEIESYPL